MNVNNINVMSTSRFDSLGNTKDTELYIVGSTSISYPEETYHNGTSWYKIWSNGWCEQGGDIGGGNSGYAEVTVNYLVSFKDLDYTILVNGNWSDTQYSSCKVTARTVSNAKVVHANNLSGAQYSKWWAFGYVR